MNKLEYYDRRKDEWSASETEQLRMEYLYKLLTIIDIADIHKRTPGDILYKCKILNIISEYKYARGYSDYINSNLYNQIMAKVDDEKKKRVEKNVGQPWTSEEDSQLISEYNSGVNTFEYYDRRKDEWTTSEIEQLRMEYMDKHLNILQIADIHKRTPGYISSKLKMMKIISSSNQARGYFDYRNSELYKEIIEKNNIERREKLPDDEKNTGQPWTLQEDSQLISEYNSAIHITKICKIHKRNIGGITSRLRKLHCINKRSDIQEYTKNRREKREKQGIRNIPQNEMKEIKNNMKELTYTVNELKENIKELNGMLHSLYEFETV